MEQKFGPCISETRLEQLNLDFSPQNIVARKTFYNQLLEKVVRPNMLKKAYLAGHGFFIKYSQATNTNTTNTTNKNRLHLYIKISSERDFIKIDKNIDLYVNNGLNLQKKSDINKTYMIIWHGRVL